MSDRRKRSTCTYYHSGKKATDTTDECEEKIKYSWKVMTEENRLKYFNMVESGNRTGTEECIICKNKLKSNDSLDDWVCCHLCLFLVSLHMFRY